MEIDQLVPNLVSFVVGFELHHHLVGVNPGVNDFKYFYQRKQLKIEDTFYFCSRSSRMKLSFGIDATILDR